MDYSKGGSRLRSNINMVSVKVSKLKQGSRLPLEHKQEAQGSRLRSNINMVSERLELKQVVHSSRLRSNINMVLDFILIKRIFEYKSLIKIGYR